MNLFHILALLLILNAALSIATYIMCNRTINYVDSFLEILEELGSEEAENK